MDFFDEECTNYQMYKSLTLRLQSLLILSENHCSLIIYDVQ